MGVMKKKPALYFGGGGVFCKQKYIVSLSYLRKKERPWFIAGLLTINFGNIFSRAP